MKWTNYRTRSEKEIRVPFLVLQRKKGPGKGALFNREIQKRTPYDEKKTMHLHGSARSSPARRGRKVHDQTVEKNPSIGGRAPREKRVAVNKREGSGKKKRRFGVPSVPDARVNIG